MKTLILFSLFCCTPSCLLGMDAPQGSSSHEDTTSPAERSNRSSDRGDIFHGFCRKCLASWVENPFSTSGAESMCAICRARISAINAAIIAHEKAGTPDSKNPDLVREARWLWCGGASKLFTPHRNPQGDC